MLENIDAKNVVEDEEVIENGRNVERNRPRIHCRKACFNASICGKGKTEKRIEFGVPILVNDVKDEELSIVNSLY